MVFRESRHMLPYDYRIVNRSYLLVIRVAAGFRSKRRRFERGLGASRQGNDFDRGAGAVLAGSEAPAPGGMGNWDGKFVV